MHGCIAFRFLIAVSAAAVPAEYGRPLGTPLGVPEAEVGVAILGYHGNHGRMLAQRRTWAARAPAWARVLFVSDVPDSRLPTAVHPCGASKETLLCKGVWAFEEMQRRHPSLKWFVRCDDESFVDWIHLRKELESHAYDDAIVLGDLHWMRVTADGQLVREEMSRPSDGRAAASDFEFAFPGGGAGWALSREAWRLVSLERDSLFAEADAHCAVSPRGCEDDAALGRWLARRKLRCNSNADRGVDRGACAASPQQQIVLLDSCFSQLPWAFATAAMVRSPTKATTDRRTPGSMLPNEGRAAATLAWSPMHPSAGASTITLPSSATLATCEQLEANWDAMLGALPEQARAAADSFQRRAAETIGPSLAQRPCVLHQSGVDIIELVMTWNRSYAMYDAEVALALIDRARAAQMSVHGVLGFSTREVASKGGQDGESGATSFFSLRFADFIACTRAAGRG